ncbi:MAG: hypothetical protein ACHQHN_19190 [Sphingobacteriales bacterium]
MKIITKTFFIIAAQITFSTCVFAQGGTSYISSDAQKSLLPHSPDAEALGKFGDLPVGLYTGIPNISIPIYQIKLKGLTIPISIDYHSAGVKVDETASSAGLDWALNAGGLINCIVYGQPDANGWLNPASGYNTPLNGSIQSDFYGQLSSYSNNQQYLFDKAAADGTIDTQPDIFSFNMPGYSGRFFFDQNQGVHLMPYQNLKVQYNAGTGTNYLSASFIITDEHGNQFYFSTIESTSTTVSPCTNDLNAAIPRIAVSIYLTKIITPLHEEVDFNYGTISYNTQNQIEETRYYYSNINRADTAKYDYIPNCVTTSSSVVGGVRLTNITNVTTGEKVVFTYDSADRLDLPGTNMLDRIEVFNGTNTSVKRFDLTHSYFSATNPSSVTADNYRLRLDGIQQYGQQPYIFTYNSSPPPPRFSLSQDHWGYYNGASNTTLLPNENTPEFNTGAIRDPDTTYSKSGVLTKITYPTGGSTIFVYEGNDYYMNQNVRTFHNGGAGGGAWINQTHTINFTVPDSSRSFLAQWTTSADGSQNGGLSQNGDNTQIVVTGPNNYSMNFTGNSPGSGETPFQGNSPDGYSLIPGNYTITITNTNYSGDPAVGAIAISWIYPTWQLVQKNVIVGGLRIKSMTDYPVNGTAKVKHFEYVNNHNPTLSSGVIQYSPAYDWHYYKYRYTNQGSVNDPSGNTTSYVNVNQCDYLAQSSGSVSPLGTLMGGNIVYSNVNVYDGDKTNGYTANHFLTLGINSNKPYFGDFPTMAPFPPYINTDWLNGLADTTINYRYNPTTQSYFPLHSIINAYKTGIGDNTNQYNTTGFGVNSNESYVRGAKITYKFPEWNPANGTSYTPQYFDAPVPAFFSVGYYHLYSSWYHLDQEQDVLYDQNGQNPVITAKNYYYDNPVHIQLTRTVMTKSDGRVVTSATTYPDDYAVGTAFLDNLKANHLISEPVEQATYQYDGTNTTILSGLITHYQTSGNGLVDAVYKMETLNPVLLSAFKFSNSTTGQLFYGNTPGTYSFDSRYKLRLTYNQYDNFGNPLMLTQTGGAPVSYQWGYNNKYPVAQVVNAPVNDIFYDSFEEGDGNTSDPKTGLFSYSNAYSKSLTGLDNGTYVLSYWSKPSGTWIFVVNNVSVTAGSYTINLPSGEYDDICFYPAAAQMKTYRYLPLVGLTSSTDEKGEITYYEYDSLQRLSNIKDKDGNIVKHFDYHFQGQ